MSESHEKEITIPDLKAKIFEGEYSQEMLIICIIAFLEYAYCNEVGFDETVAKDLIVYCEEILFSGLKIECEKMLARKIDIENVLEIYETAERAQAENLKEAALRFIRRNIKEVIKKKGIENISPCLLIELVEDKMA